MFLFWVPASDSCIIARVFSLVLTPLWERSGGVQLSADREGNPDVTGLFRLSAMV